MHKMIRFRDNTKAYRIILYVVTIVSLFSLTIEARSNESVNNQSVADKLIENNFRDYSLINVEELDQYTKDYFKKNYASLSPSLINVILMEMVIVTMHFYCRIIKVKMQRLYLLYFCSNKRMPSKFHNI